jgi:hypothetical protein
MYRNVPPSRLKVDLSEDVLVQARLQLLDDGYAGVVSVAPGYISVEDYFHLAQGLAVDLEVRLDLKADTDSGSGLVRFNFGAPIGVRYGSDEHKVWLSDRPGHVAENARFHDIFFNTGGLEL